MAFYHFHFYGGVVRFVLHGRSCHPVTRRPRPALLWVRMIMFPSPGWYSDSYTLLMTAFNKVLHGTV